MQIVVRNVPIGPTLTDPTGEHSHLLRIAVRHDDEKEGGILRPSMYLVYSKRHTCLQPITAERAAEYALDALFLQKGVETSVPKDLPKDS